MRFEVQAMRRTELNDRARGTWKYQSFLIQPTPSEEAAPPGAAVTAHKWGMGNGNFDRAARREPRGEPGFAICSEGKPYRERTCPTFLRTRPQPFWSRQEKVPLEDHTPGHDQLDHRRNYGSGRAAIGLWFCAGRARTRHSAGGCRRRSACQYRGGIYTFPHSR